MRSQDQTTTTPGPSQPSSATPANPAPTFPITPPVLSSSDSRDDNYVVFNGGNTLFIYAEKVTLASSKVVIPGKNLGIFCNQLVIDKSCNGHACIDVSGEDGNVGVSKAVGKTAAAGSTNTAPVATTIEPPTPTVDAAAPAGIAATIATSSSASNGQAGGDAGAIWLYVEAPDPDLNTTLTLKAFGGDGGKGGNGSTAGNGGDNSTCVCQLAGGKGGAGGSGLTVAESSGKRGTDQPDNHAEAFFVSLVGTRADCNIDQAFACPEQCQMILEAADALYFTNNRSKFPEAMKLYNKLTERLGFLDVMLGGDGAPIECALTTALEWLSSYYNLTTEPISQLNRIYKTAERRLSSMILNQDIWGHSATWVPRLSLAYYQARVPTMITTFGALEKVFSKYAKADQKQQLAQDQVDTAQTSNTAMKDAAKSQIQDITNTGGELDVAVAAILVFTPQMQIAQKQLSTALETFTDDIQNKFDVTPDLVLNALSTLCMAPDQLTIGVQGVNVAYQSWTTIANNKNNRVNKSYIVQQLGQCQGTISSLVNTFQTLDPGDLTAGQPDYAKIFATSDTITKLVKDFGAQVPAAASAAVTADLNNFVNLVTQRNDAVVNYNALVQTVLQLENIVASCAGESATLGTETLNFDPALPTIYFWLKRLMCQNQLQIMEELNCQARALAFWGPMDIDTVSFSTPGPMNGSINLLNYQSQLSSKFESCFDTFQSGGWSSWPESKNFLEQGIIVQLDSDTLSDIKDPTKNYTAMFPITPASSPSFSDMVNVRLTQVRVWLLGATVGSNTPDTTNNTINSSNTNNTNNTSSPSQTAAPNTSQVTTSSSPAATTPNTTSTTGSMPTPLPATGQTSITNTSHPLRIEILQSGAEVIWSPDGKPHAFSHTPVSLQFSYETTIFNQNVKCSGDPKLVYDIQNIQYDYAGGPSLPGVNEKPPIGSFCDWTVQVREDANPGLDLSSVTAGYIEFCGRNMALNEGSTLDLHTEHLWGERIKAT
ncbi:hypothetical protein Neosp_015180 [[Neocosmospora] mangrovei]